MTRLFTVGLLVGLLLTGAGCGGGSTEVTDDAIAVAQDAQSIAAECIDEVKRANGQASQAIDVGEDAVATSRKWERKYKALLDTVRKDRASKRSARRQGTLLRRALRREGQLP